MIYNLSVNNVLVINQLADPYGAPFSYLLYTYSFFAPAQHLELTFPYKKGSASNVLTFRQNVNVWINHQTVIQTFQIHQAAKVNFVHKLSTSNSFQPWSRAGPTKHAYASNVIHFTQKAAKVNPQAASNNIYFTNYAICSRGISNTFVPVGIVTYNIVKMLPVSNTIIFIGGASGYDFDKVDMTLIPIPAFPGTPTDVIFMYGNQTVVLNTPVLGDTDEIELTRINRETRNNDFIVYRDPMWPKSERFKYKFENLSQQQVWNFLNFVEMTLGQNVTMIDYLNQSWTGIITNPGMSATQDGRNDVNLCSGFSMDVEFQVVLT